MVDQPDQSDRAALIRVIQQVRRRWRAKLALRGIALIAGTAALVLLASAWGLEATRFQPAAIIAFRAGLGAVALASAWAFLIRPLRRRVTDEQVALYLEEREPSFDASLISAVGAAAGGDASGASSSALVRRLIEQALERSAAVDHGRAIERASSRRSAAALVAVVLLLGAALEFGPGYLWHGVKALVILARDVEAASPYRIEVRPGNATVPRGADQPVTARLVGFSADEASLQVRRAPGAPLERLPMVAGKQPGEYEGLLLDLAASLEYFVEAGGVSSPVYALKVVALPYVKRLDLEYRFPTHTGLEPRKVEDGGDIAAPLGTDMLVTIVPTMASPDGRLRINDAEVVPLTRKPNGTFVGRFTVGREGFYRVELDAASGDHIAASPQYTIDILHDEPPVVIVTKPGRDTTVTPLEEIFLHAQAQDDFGVRSLELVFSVNGGPQNVVPLFSGAGGARPEISAGHTLYLESLGVQPGDAVSYFARATDNDAVGGQKSAMSDMYFLRVRPFDKEFRPAQSNAGAGMGAGGRGGEVGAMSQQQRQIVVATFNLVRDRPTTPADRFKESVTLVTLAQARLREQVEGLVGRMNSRLVEPDPAFQKIAELLPQAAKQMRAAEEQLKALKPGEALAPEQRALKFLQQAEEEYQIQVQVTRQQGGGGGGGGQPGSIAEDLADLFKLELDRLANQYEAAERAQQQTGDQQVDELMERLRELARRQEQEAERQRQLQAGAGSSTPAGRDAQRALAQQAEEAARRLERLSRELQRPDLAEAARRMQDAADAMRRAATGAAGAAADAAAAARRLREAAERLQQAGAARGERDIRDLQRRAEEAAREQREITREVEQIADQAGAARQEGVRRLAPRLQSQDARVAELEKALDRAALELRREQREAARKVQEGADAMREGQVREKMRFGNSLLREGQPEYARTFQEAAALGLESLGKTLDEAAAALGRGGRGARGETLDRADDLVRGMESLSQRMRDRAQQNRRAAQAGQDRQGQPGRGQQAQGGEQARGQAGAQQGQQGSRGSQGRGGEAAGGGTPGDRASRGDARPGDTIGPWGPWGGWGGSRRPGEFGWFTPEDIRQFRGEIREWTNEARALRQRLVEQGVSVAELDAILKRLRELDAERVYADAEELLRLQEQVLEGLKQFEFKVRRQLQGAGNALLLSESDEVPEGFRDLVAEYYRALSRERVSPPVKKK